MSPARECIIVPRQIIDGLLTALHIKLNHPAANQLKLLFRRYFHTLDADKAISRSSQSCYQCAALQKIPHTMVPQSTSDPPDGIGFSFAADVIKRQQQLIFVVRETVTSYTAACLISDERHNSLRSALASLCVSLRPLDGPIAIIRTDSAPGFQALVNDPFLQENRLCIELGRVKNINHNGATYRNIPF